MIFRVDWMPPGSTQGDGRRTLAVVGHQAVGTRSSLWDKTIRQGVTGLCKDFHDNALCAAPTPARRTAGGIYRPDFRYRMRYHVRGTTYRQFQ